MVGTDEKKRNPIPVLVAALVCDVAVADPSTGKKNLIGIFDKVFAPQFPTARQMSMYVKFIDANGRYELTVQYVHSASGEKIGEAKGELVTSTPLEATDAHIQFPPLPMPRPGRYEFRVLTDSIYLGSAVIDVVDLHAPPEPEKKA